MKRISLVNARSIARCFAIAVCLTLAAANSANAQNIETWATGETLLWWVKEGPAPVPLAAVTPATTMGNPGALDNPDASVVLGGSDIDHGLQVGGRFTLGRMNHDEGHGVETNFLFLGQSSNSQTVIGDGTSFLSNPFEVPTYNFQTANQLAIPGGSTGSATLTNSHQLYGAELNGLWSLLEDDRGSWRLIGGYRFMNVEENLTFSTYQLGTAPAFFPGQFVNTLDEFETSNSFHGGQVGLRGEWTHGVWIFGSTLKVALGNTHEVLRISGETTTNSGTYLTTMIPVTTVPGGLYAQPTNIGEYSRDRFAVLPEVMLRVGLQVTPRLRTFVGYDFMYLSSIARPGNQLDGQINPTYFTSFSGVPTGPLVGEARPAPQFQSTDYWAQGVNLGVEFLW
jgi:hypothetical protein